MPTSMTIQPFSSEKMRLLNALSLLYMFYCQHFYSVLDIHRLFMEKQVMGEFVRVLKISKTLAVSLQLLQTVSILVQNLESEHAICK